MKRLLSILLIACMCLTVLTGCIGNRNKIIDDEAARAAIIKEFMKLAEIPRSSGHTEKISSYIRAWAKNNDFEVVRDKFNNVIVYKPASKGYENAPLTILQCHMDMTAVAAEGVVFNPVKDSIKVLEDSEDGTLKAEGTSLGADNGIGMATAMYILTKAENHGPLRAIFTADEENDMIGARNLNDKYLQGDYLFNLDWEDDDSIGYGSSETYSYNMTRALTWTSPKNTVAYKISISGLNGGDAGLNINDSGANAIKIIGDTLAKAQGEGILFELASFNGGASKYRIPSEASALVVLNDTDVNKFKKVFKSQASYVKKTYGEVENNYKFTNEEFVLPDKVISSDDASNIVAFIYGMINGVQSTSESNSEAVESSSNVSVVSTSSGDFICKASTTSSSKSKIEEMNIAHETISNMSGMQFSFVESSPGWTTNSKDRLPSQVSEISSDIYEKEMKTEFVHGQLECAWLIQKNPSLQMISIGPRIKNAGTADETLYLDTVAKPAILILNFLENEK